MVIFMQKKQKGFSLIELLYSLIIISLLTAFATPLYKDKIYNNMIITTKENLLNIIKRQQEHYNKVSWYDTLAATTINPSNLYTGVKGTANTVFYGELNNIIETRPVRCIDGTLGLFAKLTEPKLKDNITKENFFQYNSCIDIKIIRPNKS